MGVSSWDIPLIGTASVLSSSLRPNGAVSPERWACMFGLAIRVCNIGSALPRAVYFFLSGLDAATVGIIALAAMQLSKSTVTDNLTGTLVFLSSAAGMFYDALWYFPFREYVAAEGWVSPRVSNRTCNCSGVSGSQL
ncbi:hypothetical protein V8C34DRAFT_219305 [Trichoderma compactum]